MALNRSSKTCEWSTPQYLFDYLNAEFQFTIDACATPENAKCDAFFTQEDDGLVQPWCGTVFCNPPFGREIGHWVRKAWVSVQAGDCIAVLIVPARVDTAWWHDYATQAAEVRFVRGRVKYGGSPHGAPFPTAILVFRRCPTQLEVQHVQVPATTTKEGGE